MDRRIGEAARSVKRYVHYHHRWEAHVKSAELEEALRAKIQANISVLEQSQSLLRDYSWLLQVGPISSGGKHDVIGALSVCSWRAGPLVHACIGCAVLDHRTCP